MRRNSADVAGGPSVGLSLSPDLVPIVRTVARWADLHPVVEDVILFGDRLRSDRTGRPPLSLAVRYDPDRLTEGFDDWIEQLRTDFADLRSWLGMPIDVILPNHGDGWFLIENGAEVPAMAHGKVRCVLTNPVAPVALSSRDGAIVSSAMALELRSFWDRVRSGLHSTLTLPIASGRRPLL